MIQRIRTAGMLIALSTAVVAVGTVAWAGEAPPADESARLQSIDQLSIQGDAAAASVKALAELLKDPSPAVRARAARRLGEIGAPAKQAASELIPLLTDPNDLVRRQVIGAIRSIRPGPEVGIPIFVKVLEGSDPAARLRVMNAIADAGAEAVPSLIKALQNEKAAYWACLILRSMGPVGKDAVPALAAKIQDPNPEIRREAILALAAMDAAAEPAVPQIAAALKDEFVRIAATYALGRIGKIPAESEAVVRANVTSNDRVLGIASLWAYTRVHAEDEQYRAVAVKYLAERLGDADAKVRKAAGMGLATLHPDPAIIVPAMRQAVQGASEQVTRDVLGAIAALGPPAVPVLIDAMKHPKIRVNVVYILGGMGPAAAPAADALAGLVNDKDGLVAAEAIAALGKIGPGAKAAVPALAKALMVPQEDGIHAAIALALGKIGPEAAGTEASLLQTVGSKDQGLALLSAWALARIKPASAEVAAKTVPVLILGLAAPEPALRLTASDTLGMLGKLAKDAIPALEKATKDENEEVRQTATKALAAVRGAGT